CFSSGGSLYPPYEFGWEYPSTHGSLTPARFSRRAFIESHLWRGGFPHSDIPGSKLVCQLPGAFRRLPRPSSPVIANPSTTCTYLLYPITLSALASVSLATGISALGCHRLIFVRQGDDTIIKPSRLTLDRTNREANCRPRTGFQDPIDFASSEF